MLELFKDASRRNEETSAPVQGPSRPSRGLTIILLERPGIAARLPSLQNA